MPAMHKPIAQAVGHARSVPAHPEEIRAALKLRLGKRGRLNATLLNNAGQSRERRHHDGRHFSIDRRVGTGRAPALN
jgi:hypothetical protein